MRRFSVLLGLVLLVIVVSYFAPSLLQGSLLTDTDIQMNLKQRADANQDGTLSVREIRTTLASIIRGVVGNSNGNDINGDGNTDRADIRDTVRGFRALIGCGNGIKDGQEECDDGNTADGDGCSTTCSVETGFACTGAPSVCTQHPLITMQMLSVPETDTAPAPPTNYSVLAKFVLTAATGSDVVSFSIPFHVEEGSVENIPDIRLFQFDAGGMDPTNVGIIDRRADGSVVVRIDPTSQLLPPGTPVTFALAAILEAHEHPDTVAVNVLNGAITLGSQADDSAAYAKLVIPDPQNPNLPLFVSGSVRIDGACSSGSCPVELTKAPVTLWTISPQCGNSLIQSGETCDDSNTADGDGCSATCAVESDFTCTGEPSVCVNHCGDGVCASNETGDTVPGHVGPPYYCPQDCASTQGSGTCGDGVCQSNEIPYGCDPPPNDPTACDGYRYCPEDCI